VIIASGHTVTVDTDTASLANLTVNGTLVIGSDGTARTVTISGDVSIASGGSIAPGATAATHSMIIGGNLTNDGTFDGRPTTSRVINVTFNKNGNQTISGTGTTTFNQITLNMGSSNANVLDVQAVITMASDGLNLTNGTFKLSSASTITPFSGNTTITTTAGFHLNHASAVSNWGSSGSLTVNGVLTITSGTMIVGSGIGNELEVNGSSATATVNGGTLKVASRVRAVSGGLLTLSSGELIVPTVGHSSSENASFYMQSTGKLTMTGGTVTIQQANGGSGGDIKIISGSGAKSITSGTFQIGNTSTPANQTMLINSAIAVNNLTVNSTNATAKLDAALTVNGDVNIAAGTLDIVTRTPTVTGTLTNSGTLKQTQVVNNSTVPFLNITNGSGIDKYFGVVISTTNNLGSTTVAVSGNQICPQAQGHPVKRCYEITPTTAASADVKFYFSNSEMQSGQTLSSLNVWHYNTSTSSWDSVTKGGTSSSCGSEAIDCYVEGTGISSYSPFALKNSTPLGVALSAFVATVEAEHILVTWETASELDTRGFHLYRAESEAGPWLRLNPALIPSPAPGSPQGQAYRWEDRNVSRNATYYYRLEAVGIDNSTKIIGITAVTYAPSQEHRWLPLVVHNVDEVIDER